MIKEKHTLTNPYNRHALSRYIDVYEVTTDGCSSSPMSGYKGTEATLIDQPAWNEKFSSWSLTGATVTGNNYVINNDVTAKANYETAKNVTLQTDGHGTIAANKMSGFIGDQVTLSNTANSNYGFSGYSITGATLTGNKFNFTGSNVTAKAWFSAMPYNVILQNDGHGTIAANKTTGNTNDIITLSNTPAANYYFNNYTITGAALTGNQFAIQTSDVTAKANFAAMPVSSLFVNSNTELTANRNQTKEFEVTVNTANCNYITLKAYPSVTWNGSYNGVGWGVKELNWIWRPVNHTGSYYAIRNDNFTKTDTQSYRDYIQYSNRAWIYTGQSLLNNLKLVYDIKNSRASAYMPYGTWRYLGYGPVTGLTNKLTFQVSAGNTSNIAYLGEFRVAGFRDFTAASAW